MFTCVQPVITLALAEKDRGSAEGGGPWNQQHQQPSQVSFHCSGASVFGKNWKNTNENGYSVFFLPSEEFEKWT